jgi:hypothetical protein
MRLASSVKLKTGNRKVESSQLDAGVEIMDVVDLMPDVAADRHAISFRLHGPRSEISCAITREALEAQFWLPRDADPGRMLKAFSDGRRRIIAVAERKVRLRPGQPVRLTADDFQIRR